MTNQSTLLCRPRLPIDRFLVVPVFWTDVFIATLFLTQSTNQLILGCVTLFCWWIYFHLNSLHFLCSLREAVHEVNSPCPPLRKGEARSPTPSAYGRMTDWCCVFCSSRYTRFSDSLPTEYRRRLEGWRAVYLFGTLRKQVVGADGRTERIRFIRWSAI